MKNDGVSSAIGTIILVALTVVLVAIISAVIMGMTGCNTSGSIDNTISDKIIVYQSNIPGEFNFILTKNGYDMIIAYVDSYPVKIIYAAKPKVLYSLTNISSGNHNISIVVVVLDSLFYGNLECPLYTDELTF